MQKKITGFILASVLTLAWPAQAQLNQVFKGVFDRILINDFQLTGTGVHQDHFKPAADYANSQLTPSLNSLIARNVASFPLPATAAGVTFDFSSGKLVNISESLGPIFAETAQTLGKSRFNFGVNYTYLSLNKLRGLATRDIRFTFIHQDVGVVGLGDSENESDIVDLFLNLDVNANIFAAFGTYGVTNNLDIGVAIPFVNLSISGEAFAMVNSFTFANMGNANHRFNMDPLNPDLDDLVAYDESASGLGDIGLRVKYSFLRGAGLDLAALLDVRLPTGDEKDFLGTGKTNARLAWIVSKKIDTFSPHLNVGYERRAADRDSDQLELTAGFAQKILAGVNFAIEVSGEFDINKKEANQFFPRETESIFEQNKNTQARYERRIDLSNIVERNNDNILNASIGFRAAPSDRFLVLGNVLVPLNDGGLRSNVVPTLGVSVNF